jgi:hypothetical protein
VKGVLKELIYIAVLATAIFILAWFAEPVEHSLMTGKTCAEVMDRVAKEKKDYVLTPAERIDITNCSEP